MAHAKVIKAAAVRLIQAMMASVLRFPETVDQGSFPEGEGSCSTSFCAAGHIVNAKSPRLFQSLLKRQRELGDNSVDWRKEAIKALKLPPNVVTGSIFGSQWEWPSKFQDMYTKASHFKTDKAKNRARAKAFVARWQDILDTDGSELFY